MAEPLDIQRHSAFEPLGFKRPLLPSQPLGQNWINPKFIVPLGAQPLTVLNPSIFFSQEVPESSLPDVSFEDSPFFNRPRTSQAVSPTDSSPPAIQNTVIQTALEPESERFSEDAPRVTEPLQFNVSSQPQRIQRQSNPIVADEAELIQPSTSENPSIVQASAESIQTETSYFASPTPSESPVREANLPLQQQSVPSFTPPQIQRKATPADSVEPSESLIEASSSVQRESDAVDIPSTDSSESVTGVRSHQPSPTQIQRFIDIPVSQPRQVTDSSIPPTPQPESSSVNPVSVSPATPSEAATIQPSLETETTISNTEIQSSSHKPASDITESAIVQPLLETHTTPEDIPSSANLAETQSTSPAVASIQLQVNSISTEANSPPSQPPISAKADENTELPKLETSLPPLISRKSENTAPTSISPESDSSATEISPTPVSSESTSPRVEIVQTSLSPERVSPAMEISPTSVSSESDSPRVEIVQTSVSPESDSPATEISPTSVSSESDSPTPEIVQTSVSPDRVSPAPKIVQTSLSPDRVSPATEISPTSISSESHSPTPEIVQTSLSSDRVSPATEISPTAVSSKSDSPGVEIVQTSLSPDRVSPAMEISPTSISSKSDSLTPEIVQTSLSPDRVSPAMEILQTSVSSESDSLTPEISQTSLSPDRVSTPEETEQYLGDSEAVSSDIQPVTIPVVQARFATESASAIEPSINQPEGMGASNPSSEIAFSQPSANTPPNLTKPVTHLESPEAEAYTLLSQSAIESQPIQAKSDLTASSNLPIMPEVADRATQPLTQESETIAGETNNASALEPILSAKPSIIQPHREPSATTPEIADSDREPNPIVELSASEELVSQQPATENAIRNAMPAGIALSPITSPIESHQSSVEPDISQSSPVEESESYTTPIPDFNIQAKRDSRSDPSGNRTSLIQPQLEISTPQSTPDRNSTEVTQIEIDSTDRSSVNSAESSIQRKTISQSSDDSVSPTIPESESRIAQSISIEESFNQTEAIPQLPTVLQRLTTLEPLGQQTSETSSPLAGDSSENHQSLISHSSSRVQRKTADRTQIHADLPTVSVPSIQTQVKPISSVSSPANPIVSRSAKSSPDYLPSIGNNVNTDMPDSWSSIADLLDSTSTVNSTRPTSNLGNESMIVQPLREPSQWEDSEPDSFDAGSYEPSSSSLGSSNYASGTELSSSSFNSHQDYQEDLEQPIIEVESEANEQQADSQAADTQNLELLAYEIYNLLRQRLESERERQGGYYSGRLPW